MKKQKKRNKNKNNWELESQSNLSIEKQSSQAGDDDALRRRKTIIISFPAIHNAFCVSTYNNSCVRTMMRMEPPGMLCPAPRNSRHLQVARLHARHKPGVPFFFLRS